MKRDSAYEEEALRYACRVGVPDMCQAQMDLGLAILRQGKHRYHDAIEALERAVEEDSTNMKAQRMLSWLLGEVGHFAKVFTVI